MMTYAALFLLTSYMKHGITHYDGYILARDAHHTCIKLPASASKVARKRKGSLRITNGAAGTFRRVPVYHRVAFGQMVAIASRGQQCLRHAGGYWAPIVVETTFGLYRSAPDMLACIQETVERYERVFYGALLRGACGRDGVLRSRTRLRRQHGALRAGDGPSGGEYEE
jgi:hypothetical protein